MAKHLHPYYQRASRLLFLSGGLYIINEIFSKDIMSVHSDHGLVVMFTGALTFALAWLVRRGHGWIKYLFVACLVLSLFMEKPVVEKVPYPLVDMIATVILTLLQLWAMILLFMIPKRVSAVAE